MPLGGVFFQVVQGYVKAVTLELALLRRTSCDLRINFASRSRCRLGLRPPREKLKRKSFKDATLMPAR